MSGRESLNQSQNYAIRKYTPRHSCFPYSRQDLTPADTAPASAFYITPRIVTHIDGPAIVALRDYYSQSLLPVQPQSSEFPSSVRSETTMPLRIPRILDLCTSHISHLPLSLEALINDRKLWLCGIGMNDAEMRRNPMLRGGWAVHDLDATPALPSRLLLAHDFDRGQVTCDHSPPVQPSAAHASTDGDPPDLLDATTCVVSIDYLRRPLAVLSSVRAHTRPGGSVHLIVSNRCFPTKAVRRWLRISEAERLQMCGDYLWWSGWRDVEIVTLKDGLVGSEDGSGEDSSSGEGTTLARLMRGLGVARTGSDPLWVVRGRNIAGVEHGETESGDA